MPIYELNRDLALMNLCEIFDLKSFKAFGHYRNHTLTHKRKFVLLSLTKSISLIQIDGSLCLVPGGLEECIFFTCNGYKRPNYLRFEQNIHCY